MPLFEYYCSSCKSKFELLVNHKHADDIVCMKCHSEKVRRLLSTFALHGGTEDSTYNDIPSSMGGCGCGNGGCGCH